jgi:hypothetical protein
MKFINSALHVLDHLASIPARAVEIMLRARDQPSCTPFCTRRNATGRPSSRFRVQQHVHVRNNTNTVPSPLFSPFHGTAGVNPRALDATTIDQVKKS